MNRAIPKIRIPTTIPNVKITCHDKNIVNINFGILKIL